MSVPPPPKDVREFIDRFPGLYESLKERFGFEDDPIDVLPLTEAGTLDLDAMPPGVREHMERFAPEMIGETDPEKIRAFAPLLAKMRDHDEALERKRAELEAERAGGGPARRVYDLVGNPLGSTVS